MNNAPFYVGQKVVALESGGAVKKGAVYTVVEIFHCEKCGHHVLLSELVVLPAGTYSCDCYKEIGEDTIHTGGNAKYFAPIEPRSICIPESLKEQAEEMISVKETIKEPKKELA